MEKSSFNLKRNNKFPVVSLCIILLFPILLSSCSETASLEGSVDASSLTYKYEHSSGASTSPTGDEIAYNIAAIWVLQLNKGTHFSTGTFNDHKFQSEPVFYASTIKEHGLIYSSNQNWEANIPNPGKSALLDDLQQHIRPIVGVEFIQKGAKDGGSKTHLYYLEVPLYATYWASISTKGNIFGGLGPYIAYGIAGNVKSETSSVKAFDQSGEFKPFDAGLSFTGGYEIPNSFRFRVAYDQGLTNILRDAGINNAKAKNRTFSLNIGYPLNKIFKGK